jgi:hypothetical protein
VATGLLATATTFQASGQDSAWEKLAPIHFLGNVVLIDSDARPPGEAALKQLHYDQDGNGQKAYFDISDESKQIWCNKTLGEGEGEKSQDFPIDRVKFVVYPNEAGSVIHDATRCKEQGQWVFTPNYETNFDDIHIVAIAISNPPEGAMDEESEMPSQSSIDDARENYSNRVRWWNFPIDTNSQELQELEDGKYRVVGKMAKREPKNKLLTWQLKMVGQFEGSKRAGISIFEQDAHDDPTRTADLETTSTFRPLNLARFVEPNEPDEYVGSYRVKPYVYSTGPAPFDRHERVATWRCVPIVRGKDRENEEVRSAVYARAAISPYVSIEGVDGASYFGLALGPLFLSKEGEKYLSAALTFGKMAAAAASLGTAPVVIEIIKTFLPIINKEPNKHYLEVAIAVGGGVLHVSDTRDDASIVSENIRAEAVSVEFEGNISIPQRIPTSSSDGPLYVDPTNSSMSYVRSYCTIEGAITARVADTQPDSVVVLKMKFTKNKKDTDKITITHRAPAPRFENPRLALRNNNAQQHLP